VNPRCLGAAGALEVGDQVLALGGLLDTGEDHLGTLYFRIGEEGSGDIYDVSYQNGREQGGAGPSLFVSK
jgi:hypothetical protein